MSCGKGETASWAEAKPLLDANIDAPQHAAELNSEGQPKGWQGGGQWQAIPVGRRWWAWPDLGEKGWATS
eukprot:2071732-Rhodomonas_salina.1